MNLGDAFARRKEIQAEVQTWIDRLALTGKDTIKYQTEKMADIASQKIIPGTLKKFTRNYTIKEAQTKIYELLNEDRALARKISLTNQVARAKFIDLDGMEKEMTIPELLILRNEIAPKLEQVVRAIPKQASGVEIIETTDEYIKWREIYTQYKRIEQLTDKGIKLTEDRIDYLDVTENIDYGRPEREIFDEIDKLHAWMARIKTAINEANKTELIT